MKPEESAKLSKEFVDLFKPFMVKHKLNEKELRIKGGLIMVFESIMGLLLDVTPEEMEKFKNYIDENVKI